MKSKIYFHGFSPLPRNLNEQNWLLAPKKSKGNDFMGETLEFISKL